MTMPLLATKLTIPPLRGDLVPRPRLMARLDEGLRPGCKLLLVSAPAGFGKTTLVSSWLQHLKRAGGGAWSAAWLSLDEGDADPAVFYSYLLAVLQRIDPAIGQATQALLHSPQPPPPAALLTTLINEIAATIRSLVVVLDDYHQVESLAVHQLLSALIERQPAHMRLLIATREDPPFPLSRLRARGQVAEVRQADLGFTPEEAASFLQQATSAELSPSQVALLYRRTEGWIAGLQLAALSIRGHHDVQRLIESFAGSHRFILDYLLEDVFLRQPPEVQTFLLTTSILETFSPPLCDALTGRDDSQRVLLALEQANLFIVPLDEERQWYRYHRLFVDLLRHGLELERGDEVPLLHQRASQWYAEHGFPAQAVRHALAAADWERAADLMLSGIGTELLQRGEMVTLLGWYRALPDRMVYANPGLALDFSWALILSQQLDAAEPCLASVEGIAQSLGDAGRPLLGYVAMARSHIARTRGDHGRALELAEQALALIPPDDWASRGILTVNVGLAQWYRGRLEAAWQTLLETERVARAAGNEYARMVALIFTNRIRLARSELRQAGEACRRMIDQGGHISIVTMAFLDLARLCYEWNDLEAAAGHLERGMESSRQGGNPEYLAASQGTLAIIRQAQGDSRRAQVHLQQAVQLIKNGGVSPAARLFNLTSRVLVALGQGDLEAAALADAQAPPAEQSGAVPDYMTLMVARGRLLLAQRRWSEAAEHLVWLRGWAAALGWQSVVVQAAALQPLAAATDGEAQAALWEALALGEPQGYLRTFVDSGQAMAALLRSVVAHGGASPYAARVLAAFGTGPEEEEAVIASGPAKRGVPALVEPLSQRELEVLALLSAGQTNREIAQTLCVSVNTVKTHLRNVYGKLGAAGRRQAVARARELGMVA